MSPRLLRGVELPSFLYGTAWKEADTAPLTGQAIRAGFRGIDTANQRRHYFEAAVGEAVTASIRAGEVARSALFLQTKFTHRAGQDHRLPYDPGADLGTQVRQSFESSLAHLGTDHMDSYVLHGPSSRRGFPAEDWTVWREMEALHREEKTRLLGVSNVSLEQLRLIHAGAAVKPAFVQNRTFAATGWDRDVRAFCRENDMVYQGFSLLTANAPVLNSRTVQDAAARVGHSPAVVVFRFALDVGMLPLTGTTSMEHMRADLAASTFELPPDTVRHIEGIAARP